MTRLTKLGLSLARSAPVEHAGQRQAIVLIAPLVLTLASQTTDPDLQHDRDIFVLTNKKNDDKHFSISMRRACVRFAAANFGVARNALGPDRKVGTIFLDVIPRDR